MTDYLALIAEKTVECPDINPEFPSDWHNRKWSSCKGLGRILDPRFDGLRLHKHEVTVSCMKGCQGYSGVSSDLAVLLECARKLSYHLGLYWDYEDAEWRCTIEDPDGWKTGYGHEPLETVAKAVWEYLEQEGKVEA